MRQFSMDELDDTKYRVVGVRRMKDEELRERLREILVFREDDLETRTYHDVLEDLMQLITARDAEREAAIRIDELYSLITPVWGDKTWDEPDTYVLNLRGRDILGRIKELEAIKRKEEV